MFEILGVSDDEERVYLHLVDSADRTVEGVAASLGITRQRVRQVFTALVDRGLAARGSSESEVVPHPPDIALEALIRRRQEQLERLRLSVQSLDDDYRRHSARRAAGTEIDLVEGDEAFLQRSLQAHTLARHDLAAIRVGNPGTALLDAALEALERGVRYRSLYATEERVALASLVEFQKLVTAGEESRCAHEVGFELLVVDERMALVRLDRSETADVAGFVAREGPIVDALSIHFELLWRTGSASVGPNLGEAQDDRQLVSLLASGLTDDAVGRALGLAPRTVQRRVSRLMAQLDARSRFEAGVEAVRRGWIV